MNPFADPMFEQWWQAQLALADLVRHEPMSVIDVNDGLPDLLPDTAAFVNVPNLNGLYAMLRDRSFVSFRFNHKYHYLFATKVRPQDFLTPYR